MEFWQALILGIVQGLTEFLPISSSAHLVIIPYLFNWTSLPEEQIFVFDVLVQVSTLMAVIVYFWNDLWQIGRGFLLALWQRQPFASPEARLGWYLILATIPAGLAGVLFKDALTGLFSNAVWAAVFLLITAALMLLAERFGQRRRAFDQLTWFDALWMGVSEALAILPGVSRSGATISAGMYRHLDRPAAARFSFLMSVPIMLAAGLLAGLDLLELPNTGGLILTFLPGFVASAVVGYISIRWLLGYLTRRPLYIFSIYCLCLALLTFGVSLIR